MKTEKTSINCNCCGAEWKMNIPLENGNGCLFLINCPLCSDNLVEVFKDV